jgi:tRNA (cmo5U34)-methyltransferase
LDREPQFDGEAMNSVVESHFGTAQAPAYDERAAKFASIRDALNFLVRLILADLPSEARILCVGAGTGAELLDLAHAFPGWRFTAVEPSPAMLEICRNKADEAGIAARCEFHAGYLDSLPQAEPFDAATSILVSQFLTDPARRRDFFHQIARTLLPGGYLISADLASSLQPSAFESLFEIWLRGHGQTPAMTNASQMGWGKEVAVSGPQEVESMIAGAGFEWPTLFYQALFIHAWYAQKPSRAD